jgi:hypothetical protein
MTEALSIHGLKKVYSNDVLTAVNDCTLMIAMLALCPLAIKQSEVWHG